MTTTMTSTLEQQLLELAARVIGFEYLMYVPESAPHKGGLLYKNSSGRLQVWNPRINDGDLLQLAVAAPAFNLHDIIIKATEAGGNEASRRAYVRETFLQMVAAQKVAEPETVPAVESAGSTS
jgi:hypothetical protein